MERAKFPGWDAYQESMKEQAAEKARLAAKKKEKKEQMAQKREYMRSKTKGMPLISEEYLLLSGYDAKGACMWIVASGIVGVLIDVSRYVFPDAAQAYGLDNPRNLLILPIAMSAIAALYVLAQMLLKRSQIIYEENKRLDSYVGNVQDNSGFRATLMRTWEYMRLEELEAGSFYDISRSLLKNRVAGDRRYFDELINMPQKPAECERDMKIAETIIVTHLKKHPEDAPRVAEAFEPETLPASIRKYISKVR